MHDEAERIRKRGSNGDDRPSTLEPALHIHVPREDDRIASGNPDSVHGGEFKGTEGGTDDDNDEEKRGTNRDGEEDSGAEAWNLATLEVYRDVNLVWC